MRIIIRNMDGNTSEADVQQLLGNEGLVTLQYVQTIVQPGTGRVLAHAHITASDRDAGEQLIARLHNMDKDGQKLSVKEAK